MVSDLPTLRNAGLQQPRHGIPTYLLGRLSQPLELTSTVGWVRSAYLSEVFGAGSLVGQRSTFANGLTLSARKKRGQAQHLLLPQAASTVSCGLTKREIWGASFSIRT